MNYIHWQGKMTRADAAIFKADNKSYRYGDGLFETMKVVNGHILLKEYHFHRLFRSISILQYQWPSLLTEERLEKYILELCHRNNCASLARVRLSVYNGHGGLLEAAGNAGYLVECWPLEASVNQLNENGLVIGLYSEARKSCDLLANLKSANFLVYGMAARYARSAQLNDCLVLNSQDNIADSTIANLWWIKQDILFTPPLHQGCVDGVMRRYLLQEGKKKLQAAGYQVQEAVCAPGMLEAADAVFLTNAVRGIRWVRQFREASYAPGAVKAIYSVIYPVDNHE